METERLMHSLSAQISYYSELIQKNPEWEYAGVYADNFISGTETSKRQEFQRMLADCEAGLIDIILCKSISRFARNTVDLLETVRHLKDLGIIDMETFRYVQAEMQRRRALGPLANKALNTSCFTGKIKCPFCGFSYMHSTRTERGNPQEFWVCGNMKKKGGCCPVGGSINHKHLREACAKVLGLPEFDDDAFLEKVDVILVPARETLEFHLTDGTVITEECNNTGHQDCWTPERRAATAKRRRDSAAPNRPDATCFTKKIKCIKTPGGKDKWSAQTVRRILTNEKYKGDALLQKEFTVDFLTKKTKKNCGEIPQYYIEDDHEAIIDPAVFDLVQQEMERRRNGSSRYSASRSMRTAVERSRSEMGRRCEE